MSKIVLEDFNEGNGYYKVNLAYLNMEQVEEIETLVSTWKPTDEDIKSCIQMCLTDANEHKFKDYGTNLKDCLAWLEKQGEQKPKSDTRYEVKEGDSLSVVNGMPFDYEHTTITQKDFASKVNPFRIKKGEWYVCIHDFLNKAIRIGEIIQAEHDDTIRGIGFLYMENKYFRPAFENEIPQKPKWTDEDEENMQHCCGAVAAADYYTLEDKEEMANWLVSLKQRMEE